MPARRRRGEWTRERLTANGSWSGGAGDRPRIFILSDVRLYREGIAAALGWTNAVEILGVGAPPDGFGTTPQLGELRGSA